MVALFLMLSLVAVFVYEMHPWKLQPWEEFAKKAKAAAQ